MSYDAFKSLKLVKVKKKSDRGRLNIQNHLARSNGHVTGQTRVVTRNQDEPDEYHLSIVNNTTRWSTLAARG